MLVAAIGMLAKWDMQQASLAVNLGRWDNARFMMTGTPAGRAEREPAV